MTAGEKKTARVAALQWARPLEVRAATVVQVFPEARLIFGGATKGPLMMIAAMIISPETRAAAGRLVSEPPGAAEIDKCPAD